MVCYSTWCVSLDPCAERRSPWLLWQKWTAKAFWANRRQTRSNAVPSCFPVTRPQSVKPAPRSINECVGDFAPRRRRRGRGKHLGNLTRCREECQTRTKTGLDCSPRTVQLSSRAFDWPGVGKWDGDIYRESSHIQLTSHVFPPSDEKDCSIRDDLGEMLSQT